ncbi:hypothetical protein D3C78_1390660 [compost metagenome]
MPGIDRGDHDVVDAIQNQRRLGDGIQIGIGVLARQRLQISRMRLCLGLGDFGRAWRILIDAQVAPLPEGQARLLRGLRAAEEQVEEVLRSRHRIRRDVQHLGFHLRIAASQTGTEQDELAHQLWMTQRDLLHLKAANGEAEQIDLGQVQRLDHQRDVVGQVLDPVAGHAG